MRRCSGPQQTHYTEGLLLKDEHRIEFGADARAQRTLNEGVFLSAYLANKEQIKGEAFGQSHLSTSGI